MRQADGLRERLRDAACRCRSTSACATGIRSSPTRSREMSRDGVRRAVGFIAAAQRSYSSCTQYRENVAAARAALRDERARRRRNHLRRRLAHASRVHRGQRRPRPRGARAAAGGRAGPRAAGLHGAQHPGVDGGALSLSAAAAKRSARRGRGRRSELRRLGARLSEPQRPAGGSVARAGRLRLPARGSGATGLRRRCSAPIGFLCDHIEVLYDLDVEAAAVCREIGLPMVRAQSGERSSAFCGRMTDAVLETVERYAAGGRFRSQGAQYDPRVCLRGRRSVPC